MPKTRFGTHHGVCTKFGTNLEHRKIKQILKNIKCQFILKITVPEAEPVKTSHSIYWVGSKAAGHKNVRWVRKV